MANKNGSKGMKLKKVYDVVSYNPIPKNVDLSKCTDKGVLEFYNKRSVIATCCNERMARAIIGLQNSRFKSYDIVVRTVKRK